MEEKNKSTIIKAMETVGIKVKKTWLRTFDWKPGWKCYWSEMSKVQHDANEYADIGKLGNGNIILVIDNVDFSNDSKKSEELVPLNFVIIQSVQPEVAKRVVQTYMKVEFQCNFERSYFLEWKLDASYYMLVVNSDSRPGSTSSIKAQICHPTIAEISIAVAFQKSISYWPEDGRSYNESRTIHEKACHAIQSQNANILQCWAVLQNKRRNIRRVGELFGDVSVANKEHTAPWHGWAVLAVVHLCNSWVAESEVVKRQKLEEGHLCMDTNTNEHVALKIDFEIPNNDLQGNYVNQHTSPRNRITLSDPMEVVVDFKLGWMGDLVWVMCLVWPSNQNNLRVAIEVYTHSINTSDLETISASENFGKEVQQKLDVQLSTNVSKLQNQGFLASHSYSQQCIGRPQMDYLENSSLATSSCLSQNDVQLQTHSINHLSSSAQLVLLRDKIQGGEVHNIFRTNIPFEVDLPTIIPGPWITKAMIRSDKDFQNDLSSAKGLLPSYEVCNANSGAVVVLISQILFSQFVFDTFD